MRGDAISQRRRIGGEARGSAAALFSRCADVPNPFPITGDHTHVARAAAVGHRGAAAVSRRCHAVGVALSCGSTGSNDREIAASSDLAVEGCMDWPVALSYKLPQSWMPAANVAWNL